MVLIIDEDREIAIFVVERIGRGGRYHPRRPVRGAASCFAAPARQGRACTHEHLSTPGRRPRA
jgi:hypothetical protein